MSAIRFIEDDGGRSTSRRPKQKNDCVVRAIALVFEEDYDEVYDYFLERGRKASQGTEKKVWQNSHWIRNASRTSFQAVKGQKRTNLEDFVREHPTGRHVVQMAGHLTVVMDGEIRDTSCPGLTKCVYASWVA